MKPLQMYSCVCVCMCSLASYMLVFAVSSECAHVCVSMLVSSCISGPHMHKYQPSVSLERMELQGSPTGFWGPEELPQERFHVTPASLRLCPA